MKKLFLFLAILGTLLFSTYSETEAKSYVTDYKNPEKNLAEIQQIFILPINYEDNLALDDFARLRIQTEIQNNFKDFPIIVNWLTEEQDLPHTLTANQAKLIINVTKFDTRIHETEGRYEKTVTPTVVVGGYWNSSRYYDYDNRYYRGGYYGDRSHRYYSSRGYYPYYNSGISFGIPSNTVSTEYIPPEILTDTNVEIRFTLQNEKGDKSYWIYNQEIIEPPTRRTLSPDTEVAKITKDAVRKFRSIYQIDLRKLPK